MNYEKYTKDLKMLSDMDRDSDEFREAIVEVANEHNLEVREVAEDLGNERADSENMKTPIEFGE
ncbi:hypothetical protein ACN077_03190 [Clostridium chromiireducens]|jgi:transposase-like protein|uniref:hypothetical protein n=1 Tax=Clostridium chromiireducens TaxID=225345 RepID=UPI003AF6BD70